MRILIINDFFECGGAEEYIWNLKEELEKRGHEAHMLCFEEDERESEEEIHSVPEPGNLLSLGWNHYGFNPFKYRQIREKVEEIDPDIIHLHNNFKYTFPVLKAVRNYPTLKTVHHFSIVSKEDRIQYKDSALKRAALRVLYPPHNKLAWYSRRSSVDKYITPAKMLKRHLEEYCNSVLHLPDFVPEREPSIGGNHLLFVGRLEKEKGVDIALKALSRLENPPELNIAGRGPDKSRLRGLISDLGLENTVSLEGFVSEERLEELYRGAIAVLIPSIWNETGPLTGIEALSYGKPIIGSDKGGIKELIEEEKTGLLFEPGDPEDLAQKLKRLEDVDTEKMGENSRQKYERTYTPEKHMERLMQIYERTINEGRQIS